MNRTAILRDRDRAQMHPVDMIVTTAATPMPEAYMATHRLQMDCPATHTASLRKV
ncbi:MAG TPA: hypothetical protein VFW00_09390 [Rhodocyclaceae bacterium]|nr:hypothetical protein [Rhodocyclaceae bacterium]